MNNKIIISCEHASNKIPNEYRSLFVSNEAHHFLETHLGLDLGAKNAALYLAKYFSCSFVLAEYSRLLVELNRSENHPHIFSKFTAQLTDNQKNDLIKNIYLPYRQKIENLIQESIEQKNRVIHLSIHSFTPKLNNKIRTADIGLLYDPKKDLEKKLCSVMKKEQLKDKQYKLKLNYPYRGYSDGFTTYLRTVFGFSNYLGIEIEINQKHSLNNNFSEDLLERICYLIKVSVNNL
tara:strand:- start:12090 stop:12794 length:705 start_codon:yes stop_codon:yes gene_type:complete